MPSNTETYCVEERLFVEENNLQIGDFVTITRTAEDRENGWANSWNSPVMDTYISGIHRVININNNGSGITLEGGFSFPYFAIRKVRNSDSSRINPTIRRNPHLEVPPIPEERHFISIDGGEQIEISQGEYEILARVYL